MMKCFLTLLSVVFVFSLQSFSFASDHIDGPITKEHAVGDLSDLYLFKSLENKNNIVMILNMYPLVGKNGHFSSRVSYEFKIKTGLLQKGLPSVQFSKEKSLERTDLTRLEH